MNKKYILGAAGLVTAGMLAGGIMSMAGAANAADVTPIATGSTTAPVTPVAPKFDGAKPADGTFDPGGADSVRDDEKVVTGADAATLKAAAEARVVGATAFRVETDGDGAAYEVHLKKADGTLVTVKFDADLKITSVDNGMGAGGPGGKDGHGPDNDGDGPGAQSFSTTPTPTQSN